MIMEKCSISNKKGSKKLKKTSMVKSKSAQPIMKESNYRFNKITKLAQASINYTSTKHSTGQFSKSKIIMSSPNKTQKRTKKVNKKNLINKSRVLKNKRAKTEVDQKMMGNQHIQLHNQLNQFKSSLGNRSVPKLRFFRYFENQIPIQNTHERRFVEKLNIAEKQNKIRNTKINYKKKQASQKSAKGKELCGNSNYDIENFDKQTQARKVYFFQFSSQTEKKLAIENKVIEQNVIKENINQRAERHLQQFLKIDPSTIGIQKYKQSDRIELFLRFKELTNLFMPKINLQSQCQAQRQYGNRKLGQNQISYDKNIKQIVNGLINQRWCIQMGWVKIDQQQRVNTDIYSVLQYLSNLFYYSQIVEKKQIVKRVRSIFGYPYRERLKNIQKEGTSTTNFNAISDKVFLSLQRELRAQECQENLTQSQRKQKLQLICYHNRAIFDCTNQILETYRPFYYSKGEPFPWTNSLVGTTYFIIDQDSLQILFKEVKDRVLANCAVLYGIHIQDSSIVEQQKQQISKLKHTIAGNKSRLDQYSNKQLNLILKEDLKKSNYTAFIQEQQAFLLLEICKIIQFELFSQFSEEIGTLL